MLKTFKFPIYIENFYILACSNTKSVLVKRINRGSCLPLRDTNGSVGYSLRSVIEERIPPGHRKCISTGIALQIPLGKYGRIASHSGLTMENGIVVGAGVIDNDYRGEVFVVMFNFGEEDFIVRPGDKIAQIIFEKVCLPRCREVCELSPTERGNNGFGSTGR